MDRINIFAVIRLGSFALNIILLLMLYKGCNCEPCDTVFAQVIQRDTVYIDTTLKEVKINAHAPKKQAKNSIKKRLQNKIENDSIPCDTVRIYLKEIVNELPDTLKYSDTLRADNDYKIVYDATVEGKLIDFKLWHANLKPEIKTTITNTVFKKSKPQIYLGAIVGLNNNATNFVFGPSAAIGYKSFLTNYAYDIRSGSHQIGGYWRVWGK